MQADIINSLLAGHDTLAILPTGGGKSICFQVPALVQKKLYLVISPLIALMKDQVENLRRKGITALAIYSGMTRKEVINTLQVAGNSNCRFLYVSPERIETSIFQEYLPGLDVACIVVDEAHCISQWGYDFRPPYLRIAALRKQLPGVPVLALTASATPEVQEDICDKLAFNKPLVFKSSFERKNLSYSVLQPDSKINRLVDIVQKVPGSAIIYCRSRKRTQEIGRLLQMHGITADYYHAGLSLEERNRKQQNWINNTTRIIVCTNAFGMGIDKPDVRLVLHADVPDCIENYYQEAGRAGRDGLKSYAVLLCNKHDIHDLEKMAATRFPTLDMIRNTYQSLANYLQIPVMTGMATYFDFDFPDFIQKFKLDHLTTYYSIKALEQDGWLAYNEQVFVQATVMFNASRQELTEFEILYPGYEPVIKCLLRSYEGIYDFPVPVSETMIAGLLKTDVQDVKNALLVMHSRGIIQYQPQKDTPQIFLLQPRIKAEDLNIDLAGYKHRQTKYLMRMQAMIEYVNDTAHCRSTLIAGYFGDHSVQACGICNNCIDKKRTALNEKEFQNIQARIKTLLLIGPVNRVEFFKSISPAEKEKTLAVIDFLQAENMIEVLPDGSLQWIS